MKEMLEFLHSVYKKGLYERPFIIAGNVASWGGVADLEDWGADATKVGIAQGDACTTYGQTGFGLPMFTCIQECAAVARKPVIADGGIRTNGDFAKAIVAGGTMVMAGSVFAACIDSPAETIYKISKTNELREGMKIGAGGVFEKSMDEILAKRTYKTYFGSASAKNKGANVHVEGRVVELECNKMTYADKLDEITQSLQSAVSYAGGDLSSVEYGIRS
jgi:GMP reductase